MNQNEDGYDKMRLAMERLDAERVRYKKTTAFQLKVGPYNFYPGKCTIYMDGDQKFRPERGLDHFLMIVRKLRDRNPRTVQRNNTAQTLLKGTSNNDDFVVGDPAALT